jgi:hypothetical protein
LGSDEELLKEGDVITDTQSSLIIEELIGKFLPPPKLTLVCIGTIFNKIYCRH